MSINADRAVSHVRYNADHSRIEHYRAFLPFNGVITTNASQIDITRKNLIADIQNGKRVITVTWDGTQWIEGSDVQLTKAGYLRTEPDDTEADNLGDLPEIQGQLLNRP